MSCVMRRGLPSQMFRWIAVVALLAASAASAEPPEKVSGVWVGSIVLSGLDRTLVLQIEERKDGRLLGYVVGHSGEEVVVSGSALHKNVSLVLEIANAAGKRQVSYAGRLRGRERILGEATAGTSVQAVDFALATDNLRERRFLVAVPAGEDFIVNDLVAVTSGGGTFVSGAFTGRDSCALWGCEGRLDAFSSTADGGTLDFSFRTSDPCSAGSSAHLEFDEATSMYSGTYTLNTCAGSTTSELLGVRDPATQSSDVAHLLRRLANLADRMERSTPFGTTDDSFSPFYLDWGMNLGTLLGRYNAEKVKYSSIEASFSRFREITTIIEPGTWPDLVRPLGPSFLETRRGIPADGTTAVTYVDSENVPDRPLLRHWAKEGGEWVIRGNDSPALEFPFEYDGITPDGMLRLPVRGGADNVYVSLGPFGVHFTGHAYGDLKGNLAGFFTADDSGLTPLADGRLAYYGGPGGARLLARRPLYRAPQDAEVTRIECVGIADTIYLNDQPNWSVHLRLRSGPQVVLGHVGELHPQLRAAALAATGLDPGAVPCLRGFPVDNIFGGDVAIPVSRHAPLAWPQVVASEVAGLPGYYSGGGAFRDRPWVQMEFFFKGPELSNRYWADSRGACYYNYMAPSVPARLQEAMLVDMTNPVSQRYRQYQGSAWNWMLRAEARLCMAPSDAPRDFRDLYTNLGGWYEFPRAISDEIVSFAPIATDIPIYDPSDYYSPATTMLIARRKRADGPPFIWTLPGRGAIVVHPPNGEIVERTADQMLIRWRYLRSGSLILTDDFWQRATYSLDPVRGLKIRWGVFATTPAGATAPAAVSWGVGLGCDTVTVVCYNHDAYYAPGF